MRCPHLSFADFVIGMSSDRQVRHSTLLSLAYIDGSCEGVSYSLGGFSSLIVGANMPKKLARLFVAFEFKEGSYKDFV